MELIPLNLKPLDNLFYVLDRFYPEWEKRQDDYYLTELAFFILQVFNAPYTDETIINNLRACKVDKFQNELEKLRNTPPEVFRWVLAHRMRADRAKASYKRYVTNKGADSHLTKKRGGITTDPLKGLKSLEIIFCI